MLRDAITYLRERMAVQPRVAVVLGSGLGGFADELSERSEFPYRDIPHWPRSTAIGHAGKLVVGLLEGVPVAAMAGRAHLYEGYTPAEVTFGVRVLRMLGARSLVLTNAAGGINLAYSQGALVAITDHINLQCANPLAGVNNDELGPRFPDMSEAYSRRYREIAQSAAAELGIELSEGVYAAMLGPSYETPAEIRFLRTIGADLVGMSTVPEVIAANHMGMPVLAISCVTNMAAGILPQRINHDEVLEAGARVRGTLVRLLRAVIPRLEASDGSSH
ncbi:MAG TPA: purine-nucleoside phosphorylase [Bryobacteraceae bacterium]|nr:purine-nucleoside phosphorylase [Bryobacteraceae bacterium]